MAVTAIDLQPYASLERRGLRRASLRAARQAARRTGCYSRPPLPARRGFQTRRFFRRFAENCRAGGGFQRRVHRFLRRAFHGRSGRYHFAAGTGFDMPDLSAGCSMADMADLEQVERAWRELDIGARCRRRNHPGHLHQFGRQSEIFLRPARRHRLHLDQCAKYSRLVVRASRKGSVFPRPAPRPQHRLQDGHSARGNGGLGLRPADGRADRGADPPRENHPVEGILLGAPDVQARADREFSPRVSRRHRSSRTPKPVSRFASNRITSARPNSLSKP